ncbi:MAG: VWA domain-containing protein [Vallitaleaceae bacterium]|jgi:hypothetical protein|nr:VWA domain-containing protein [Vallitaleaceae bacterium]
MKRLKQLVGLFLTMTLILNLTVMGAVTTTDVTITSAIKQIDNTREFEVKYTVDVSGQSTNTPSVVLVLDRSGSMLFKDSNGNLVVDSVKVAAKQFVISYFDKSPNSELAIVSFGSNANAHDNYKYYNDAKDALDEIDYIYAYNYNYWYGNYYWRHWNSNQGGTNIGEAFEYAVKTVEKYEKKNAGSNVIVLFSDGVANAYKKGNGNGFTGNYPTSENQSTVYAYTEGQYAYENVADVMTVGYFGAYNDMPAVQELAISTLKKAQNAGFFTTNDIDYVDDLFQTVVNNLDYIGTGTTVTDVINSEFDVIPESIEPSGATLVVNPTTGQTTITWDVGNLTNGKHEYTYRVKAKDNIYPSGKDNVIVNDINAAGVGLRYTDLNNEGQVVAIPEAQIDVPSHDIIPGVDLFIIHINSESKEYLVGDIALINHDLFFSNEYVDSGDGNSIMFDFVQVDVKNYTKELVYASNVPQYQQKSFSEVLELQSPDWILTNNTLEYTIDETSKNSDPTLLKWNKELELAMECLEVGEFDFEHTISFDLYNPYITTAFPQAPENLIEDEIKVANGTIIFNMESLAGDPIDFVNIIFDDGKADTVNIESTLSDSTVINDGKYTIDHLKTGTYDITIEIPSGYKIPDSYSSSNNSHGSHVSHSSSNTMKLTDGTPYTLDVDGNIVIAAQELNYQNSELVFGMEFEALEVANIALTTNGESTVLTNSISKATPVKMTFSPLVNMTYMKLPIVDTFSGEGNPSYNTGSLIVKDKDGNVIKGFTLSEDGELEFKNTVTGAPTNLLKGDYTAEFIITGLPSGLTGGGTLGGYEFDLTVKQTTTKKVGASSNKVSDTTAKELTVFYDDIAPVIVSSENGRTNENLAVDIIITDSFSDIVDYRLVEIKISDATIDDFTGIAVGYGFASMDITNLRRLIGDIEVSMSTGAVETPSLGLYRGNGNFAILATDKAGNTSIEIIKIGGLNSTFAPDLL